MSLEDDAPKFKKPLYIISIYLFLLFFMSLKTKLKIKEIYNRKINFQNHTQSPKNTQKPMSHTKSLSVTNSRFASFFLPYGERAHSPKPAIFYPPQLQTVS